MEVIFDNKICRRLGAMSTILYFVDSNDVLRQGEFRRQIHVLGKTMGGHAGFLFPAECREAALNVMDWDVVQTKELPTQEWSVNQLVPSTRALQETERAQIVLHDQASEAWKGYLELVAGWCRQRNLNLPVVIHYRNSPHGFYQNGGIHLCFGGLAAYRAKVWFKERDVAYQRSHMWIGELGPEHQHCRDLIPQLLEEFVPKIVDAGGTFGENAFVERDLRQADGRKNRTNTAMDSASLRVAELQNALVDAIREEEQARQAFQEAETARNNLEAHLKRELEAIRSRPYVNSVVYNPPVLSVFIERILIRAPGEEHPEQEELYDLGEYRIDILTEAGNERLVKVFNMTRQGPILFDAAEQSSSPSQHPHISGFGNPCLGTIKNVVPRYIATRNYSALVDIMYRYLGSVDLSDTWGRTLRFWPRFETRTS